MILFARSFENGKEPKIHNQSSNARLILNHFISKMKFTIINQHILITKLSDNVIVNDSGSHLDIVLLDYLCLGLLCQKLLHNFNIIHLY